MVTVLQRIRSAFQTLQTVWSIAGLTLLAVLLIECGLQLVFAIKDQYAAKEQPDPRVVSEGYGGESWPVQHYRELERLQDRWEPYVYFRQRAFAGETIAIDQEGLRLTWQAPPAPADGTETEDIPAADVGRVVPLGLRGEERSHDPFADRTQAL